KVSLIHIGLVFVFLFFEFLAGSKWFSGFAMSLVVVIFFFGLGLIASSLSREFYWVTANFSCKLNDIW
ncbi:hypothetical protein, partial [Vibrio cincinnatiensis]